MQKFLLRTALFIASFYLIMSPYWHVLPCEEKWNAKVISRLTPSEIAERDLCTQKINDQMEFIRALSLPALLVSILITIYAPLLTSKLLYKKK